MARAKAKAEADQAFKDEEKEIIAKLGKPHNLTASNVTATSMQLSWKMNTSFNNIRGYRVFYKHDSYADIKTFNGQLPRFSLSGLVPYTQYNVWVRPISTSHPNVIAEESETILQTTDTAEPSAPFITNVTCYETQKIYIEWKRPTLYYKTINYYFVYYRAEGEREFKSHQMQADSKDDQRFFLEQENSSLTPRKNYCIKISAGTRSTSSDIVYQVSAHHLLNSGLYCTYCRASTAKSSACTCQLMAVASRLLLLHHCQLPGQKTFLNPCCPQ